MTVYYYENKITGDCIKSTKKLSSIWHLTYFEYVKTK